MLLSLTRTAYLQEKPGLKIGQAAPTFVLKDLNGAEVFLRDYCGELRQPWKNKTRHVIILSFFATWCQPCMKEIPQLQDISKEFHGKNLKILLINLKEDQKLVRRFWADRRIQLPVLLDKYGIVAEQYHVDSLPRLFVIDREGKLVYQTTGYKEDLGTAVRQVLAGQFH